MHLKAANKQVFLVHSKLPSSLLRTFARQPCHVQATLPLLPSDHAHDARWLAGESVRSRSTWPRAWWGRYDRDYISRTALLTPYNTCLLLFCSAMADSSTSPTYTLGGAESTTSDDFIRSSQISSSQSPPKSSTAADDISHVKRPMNAFMVSVQIAIHFDILLTFYTVL